MQTDGFGVIADQLRRSTVTILSKGQGSGSGVVWDASGLIVTNAHVVRGLGEQKWVQADIRLAPGNSGGPLADAGGRVVGVNAMIASGLGLAVPSEAVRRFVERGTRAVTLGVAVQPARLRFDGQPAVGLVVVDVTDGSPAAAASVMLGDVLIGVNGRALTGFADLREAIDAGLPQLTLRFLRGERNRSREVTVRLRRAEAA